MKIKPPLVDGVVGMAAVFNSLIIALASLYTQRPAQSTIIMPYVYYFCMFMEFQFGIDLYTKVLKII